MRILVFGTMVKEENETYINTLFDALAELDIHTTIYASYKVLLEEKGFSIPETSAVVDNIDESSFDYVLTLGGDGTILSAAAMIGPKEIPILGINLGRLGFLANTEKNVIRQALEMLKAGNYTISERSMLFLDAKPGLFGDQNFALNDFTILKRDNSSMIGIHTFVNGDFLNTYWADGLIVSTPTGSTGYSLSGGGPIIFPDSKNFVITAVAAHNLGVRPIVIPDDAEISFSVEGRAENFLCTLDSRFEIISAQHQLKIRKCDFVTKLIVPHNTTFLKTMRQKLKWGGDIRKSTSESTENS